VSLVENVKRWFNSDRSELLNEVEALRLQLKSIQLAPPYEGQSGYIAQPEDLTGQSLCERQDSNIAVAIRIISNALSWLPLYPYQKDIIDGAVEYEVDTDHPCNILIDQPNPFLSGPEMKAFIAGSLKLMGNCFLKIERRGGDVYELWPIPPYRVTIDYDKKNGIPVGFIIDMFSTIEQRIPLEDMVHIRDINVNNPFYGMSSIKPLERLILMDMYGELFNKNFFKNGCTMSGIYAPDIELNEDQLNMVAKSYNAKHKGVDNAFKMFFPALPGKFWPTSIPLKDLAFADMFRMNREKLYATMGIPPAVGGVFEHAKYENAQIQERMFWRHTMTAMANTIADALTRQLMWRLFDRDHVLLFDFTGVEALQPDKLIEAQRLSTITRKIITQNEARKELGYDRIEIESADELDGGMIDYFADPFMNEDDDEEDEEGDDKASRGTTLPPRKSKQSSPREKAWRAFDNFLIGKERGYQRLVKSYFGEQYKRVLAALNKITGNGLMIQTGLMNIHKAMTREQPIPSDPDNIFNMQEENAALRQSALPYIKQAMKDSGNRFFGDYNIDLNFNINDPNVISELERMINRSDKINDTTYDALKNMFSEAYDNNWSMSEVEKQIKDIYKYASDIRARTIARTEMLRAVNGGTLAGYEQGGVQKKEWLASMDANTRDTHAALNGEVVRVGEPFTRGSVPMDYPGDPTAPAEEVINCRCTLMPVFETE